MSKQQEMDAIKGYVRYYKSVIGGRKLDSDRQLADELVGLELVAHRKLQEAKLDDEYGNLLDTEDVQVMETNDIVNELSSNNKDEPAPQREQPMTTLKDKSWEYMSLLYVAEKTVKSRTAGDFFRHPFRFIKERIALGNLRDKVEITTDYSKEQIDTILKNMDGIVRSPAPKKQEEQRKGKEKKKTKAKETKLQKEEQPKLSFTEEELKQIEESNKKFQVEYDKQTAKIQKDLNESEGGLDYGKLGNDAAIGEQKISKVSEITEPNQPVKEIQEPGKNK